MADAVFDFETLPVKINVRLRASLKLKPPADGVVNFAIRHNLVDRDARVAGCEFGDGICENCLLGFGRERVGKTQPVWTRLRQRETVAREDEGGGQKSNSDPFSQFQCCSHSDVRERTKSLCK